MKGLNFRGTFDLLKHLFRKKKSHFQLLMLMMLGMILTLQTGCGIKLKILGSKTSEKGSLKTSPNWSTVLLGTTGSSNHERGKSIAIGSKGNLYITGHTKGDLNGDGNIGGWDGYLAKYDRSGNQIWIEQFGTGSEDQVFSIALDDSNNAYITGDTKGDIDGEGNTGLSDFFIAKYNSSGVRKWITQGGGIENDNPFAIAWNKSSNSVYISGQTEGDLDGVGNLGNEDLFQAKYNSDGTQKWINQMGTSGEDYGAQIVYKNGSIFSTGYVNGQLDGQTYRGGDDIYILKQNSMNGKLQ